MRKLPTRQLWLLFLHRVVSITASVIVLSTVLSLIIIILFSTSSSLTNINIKTNSNNNNHTILKLSWNKLVYSSSANTLTVAVPKIVQLQQQQQQKQSKDHTHISSSSSVSVRQFSNPTLPVRKAEEQGGSGEAGLVRARAAIRMAALIWSRNLSLQFRNWSTHHVISGGIYHNPSAFFQSYVEMERRFKVYVYKEGELPLVHDGPCKDIYTIEGRFIHQMETTMKRFRTKDPRRAQVFFMPFSVTWMVKYLYRPLSYDVSPLKNFVSDYVRLISTRHPFWNRTEGADHFMLSCHDWGPHASRGNANLYNNSIRVLCNANSSEGFNPQKDVSLPEIHLYGGKVPSGLTLPPPPHNPRPHLAFFAGGLHGPIRPILLQHWKDRDPLLQVYEYLPRGLDYYSFTLKSKYCLCPSGHEVASPRVVEAIYAECVPVILSDHYVLPFSDVLRWEAFSIKVEVSEIPRLKEVLMAVPEDHYLKLKEGLRAARRHFVLNQPPKRFDVFHMILHSVWLRRINLRLR